MIIFYFETWHLTTQRLTLRGTITNRMLSARGLGRDETRRHYDNGHWQIVRRARYDDIWNFWGLHVFPWRLFLYSTRIGSFLSSYSSITIRCSSLAYNEYFFINVFICYGKGECNKLLTNCWRKELIHSTFGTVSLKQIAQAHILTLHFINLIKSLKLLNKIKAIVLQKACLKSYVKESFSYLSFLSLSPSACSYITW